jgi:hypothetical protein
MLANSLRLRGIRFAFLFGPPRFVKREEASKVHSAVCDATSLDDFSFKYSTIDPDERLTSKGFSIVFERKEGRGALAARIDNKNIREPIRILLEYTWPPTIEHVTEYFDNISESVFDSLEGNWTKVLAEVRLSAQCNTRSNDGLTFLREKVLGLPPECISGLGEPLSFCGVKLEVGATQPQPSSEDQTSEDQIKGAKRELSIELLREDQTCVYLELVSQWPQVAPLSRNQTGQIVLGNIRKIDSKPSAYIGEALSFLNEQVEQLGRISKK